MNVSERGFENQSNTAGKAAWICLAVAWATFLVPIPGIGLFIGWPLNLVAFILAIVAMSKLGAAAGLWQILASLIASPIVYFIGVLIFAAFLSASGRTKPSVNRVDTPDRQVTMSERPPQQAIEATNQKLDENISNETDALTTVTSIDIARAYDANTVAADLKFKGKRFRVSGYITEINTDFMGTPYITMHGTNEFSQPQFAFDDEAKSQLASLKRGMPITLICTGNGDIAKTPMSDSCEVVPSEVPSAIESTSTAKSPPLEESRVQISPSFDCNKAQTSVELGICASAELSRLDKLMSQNYKVMMAADIGDGAKQDLLSNQRIWLRERNTCQTESCIESAYKKRIASICDYPVISGVYPNCQ